MKVQKTKKIVILTKESQVGNVKTRLAQKVGLQNAAKIHFEMTTFILEELIQNNFPIVVSLDVIHKKGPLYQFCILHQIPITIQSEGDLGTRMWFEMNRYSKCVIIGSDMPLLPIDEIQYALDSSKLCLGPSIDGGYWLISMSKPSKELFTGIAWSTSQVLQQSVEHAKKLHYPVHFLSKRYDIDTYSDLQSLLADSTTPSILKKRILPYA